MYSILLMILSVVFGTLIGGAALYLGAKVTRESVLFKEALIIAFAASLVSLIPWAGWILSWVVMLMLLSRWCGCEVWPNGVLLSVIANLIQKFLTWLAVLIIIALITLFSGSHIDEDTPVEEETTIHFTAPVDAST